MNMMLGYNEVKFATFAKCLDVICDMGFTPYIMVNTTDPEYCGLMADADENGIIVLNIATRAVHNFYMDEQGLSFSYSQGGVKGSAFVPMSSLASIYAKEDRTVSQPFPFKSNSEIKLTEKPKAGKVSAKAVKKGWQPRLIKGGKT